MLDDIHGEPRRAMGLRRGLQICVCLCLALGFMIAVGASISAPRAGAALVIGDRTSIASNDTLNISPTKTPTLTPTRKPLSPARAPQSPLSPQTIPGQPTADANTVLLYHFDAPTGNTDAIDATGNYTGTLFGNAVITTSGLYSGALQVDGNASYVRTGNLGDMPQGTIEAFVDFYSACTETAGNNIPIVAAGGEYGSNQPVLVLRVLSDLVFDIYVNGQVYEANSGVNPCKYLTGISKLPFPYDPVRFHHVAGTWGPRGMEIWIDGVLHGVGNLDNTQTWPYRYMCDPQMQLSMWGYYNPYVPYACLTPVRYPTMASFPIGDYRGGLPAYNTFLIGCDSTSHCFHGRIDEVRISNVQRTFTMAVLPTLTPIPTQTPVYILGEYSVDGNTAALYHLNFENHIPYPVVLDEVTQQYKVLWGQAVVVPGGRFNSGLALDGNGSYLDMGNPGYFLNGTVEAWVNLDSGNGGQVIFETSQVPGGIGLVLALRINPQSGNLEMLIEVSDGQSHQGVDSGVSGSSLVGCWHHVAGTWGGRGLEMWIDGTLRNVNSGYTGGMYAQTDDWHVGCDFAGYCMNGRIDEVRVSSVQRTFTASAYGPVRAARAGVRSGIRAPLPDGNLVFLPMIQVGPPPPPCPFGP